MQNEKRQSRMKPLWDHRHIGKYSLEEIALEFILWEDTDKHNDRLRQDFINQALNQSFGHRDRGKILRDFLETYEKLYEKIYQCKQGNMPKENRATPESMRLLVDRKVDKKAA